MRLKKPVVIIGALAMVGVLVLATYLLASDQQGGEEVGSKGDGEPHITPPKDKTLRLTIPKMAQIKDDEIPTGLGTDEALFHDYAAVHIKYTGWPWEKEANEVEKGDQIYITDSEGRKYTYKVFRKFVVTPDTLSVLNPVEGRNIVTLQTCTLPDYTNRLLVRGELKDISEE